MVAKWNFDGHLDEYLNMPNEYHQLYKEAARNICIPTSLLAILRDPQQFDLFTCYLFIGVESQ